MKNLYAVLVTVLALFVTLVWSFMGPLSLVALVGWVGALLTGHTSQLSAHTVSFALAVNGLFVAVWVYTVWTWRRVSKETERRGDREWP